MTREQDAAENGIARVAGIRVAEIGRDYPTGRSNNEPAEQTSRISIVTGRGSASSCSLYLVESRKQRVKVANTPDSLRRNQLFLLSLCGKPFLEAQAGRLPLSAAIALLNESLRVFLLTMRFILVVSEKNPARDKRGKGQTGQDCFSVKFHCHLQI